MAGKRTPRSKIRTGAFVLATAAAAVAAPLAASPALAAGPSVTTIAKGLPGPLHLAADGGVIYVGSSPTGEPGSGGPPPVGPLFKFQNGHKSVLTTVKGGGVEGISVQNGRISYTTSIFTAKGKPVFVGARELTKGGSVSLGNTLAYEKAHNPDKSVIYGFQGLTKSCIKQLPKQNGPLPAYHGIVDSHPYSITDSGGKRFIADAAGNDILQVTSSGLKTVAVLPPTPIQVTAGIAKGAHLPACVAGHTYVFEPVPTDIEMGPDGLLYVSALTAAAEIGAPAGMVYSVNPDSGAVKVVAGGLNGATGLAVTGNGTIYVAELFGNRISRIVNGHPQPFLAVPLPADVEWDQSTTPGSLYATTNALNPKGGDLIHIMFP
jgi:hypothetical protein